jgi:phage terminase large subunit GpA-like protein
MDCLSSESPVQRVVMMFAAQTGKTEAGSNWLGYVIDHAPGPMLCVQPTIEMAKRLSKQRLESMITETPCWRPRSRRPGAGTLATRCSARSSAAGSC